MNDARAQLVWLIHCPSVSRGLSSVVHSHSICPTSSFLLPLRDSLKLGSGCTGLLHASIGWFAMFPPSAGLLVSEVFIAVLYSGISQLGFIATFVAILHLPDMNPSDPACLYPWSRQINQGSNQSFNRVDDIYYNMTDKPNMMDVHRTSRTHLTCHWLSLRGRWRKLLLRCRCVIAAGRPEDMNECLLRSDISSAPVIILSLLVQFSSGRIELAQCLYVIIVEDVVHLLVKNLIIHLQ